VAIADGGRGGEVRFLGDVDSSPVMVPRLIRKLTGRYTKLLLRRGPTGYGLYRQIRQLGHDCVVVAPIADPGGAAQDQPTRCGHPGSAAARRQAYGFPMPC
jgi:transposase